VYVHEKSDWPNFRWDNKSLAQQLAAVRHQQGRLIGRMEGLGFELKREAVLCTITEDVLKTSEIEGEFLDWNQVRSSVARHLGMNVAGLKPASRDIEGIVEMMLDATQKFNQPLTAKRLFSWHAAMFPTGRSGMHKILVGRWRKGSADVVSGPIGSERVHFEAPVANRLNSEMKTFLQWFESETSIDPVLKAGIAHLWFVTIHPFDDGNGRIARAIADLALARCEQIPQRFYSMSAQIHKERKGYYQMLERTQKGTMEITPWLIWFLDCLGNAINGAQMILSIVLRKAKFWQAVAAIPINKRQHLILNRLLDGFVGKLTSSKWAKLAKCSQDTAHRDITYLLKHGILTKDPAAGRSTNYSLVRF